MNKNHSLSIEKVFELAIENHQKNNHEAAKNLYEKVLKIDPNYARAHNNLGVIFKALGEHQKAKDCFEKAIEINPNYAHAHSNIGAIFNIFGDTKKAIDCYEKAIEIDPKHKDALYNLGGVFKNLGDTKKAINCYQKVIEIDPRHKDALYNLGVALLVTKQYKNALEQFTLSNYKNSKSFLLTCLYKLDDKASFFRELDNLIKQGKTDALIGSLTSRSEIKYGIKKPNLFCEDPLEYTLMTNLTKEYDFKNVFVKPITDILKENIFAPTRQGLLTNGYQTAGDLFAKKNDLLNQIQNIIHLEVEKYHDHFKKSKEGLIKNWPKSYNIYAWLVSMKSGGKLDVHMHDHGWLSGSIYINVPPKLETDSGNLIVCIDDQVSELKKNINLKKIMNVVTGSLCLFPSSLYHYTVPFESKEERIVLAFDIIPDGF